MTPLGRRCFPPFSFLGFIAWFMPWLSSSCPNNLEQTSDYVQPAAAIDQTGESLSVMSSDLRYLTRDEAEQIIDRFKKIPQSSDRLLFWTGVPRCWVERWAGEHGLLTLTSVMGPLMDVSDPRCLKSAKKPGQWSRYVKGASGIFARYACGHGIVRVLTLPPSYAEFVRPKSSYLTIEEPVLKGSSGCCCAVQINTVHLLENSKELEYQSWPQNRMSEIIGCKDDDTFEFRLPPRILKAVKAAGKILRSRVVSLTASTTSRPTDAIPTLHSSGFPAAKKQQESSERQNMPRAPKERKTQQLARTGKSSTKANVQEEKAGKPWSDQLPSNKQAKSKQRSQINKQQTQSDKQQPTAKHPQGKKNEPESEQRLGSKQAKSKRPPQINEQKPQKQRPKSYIQANSKKQYGTRLYPAIQITSLNEKTLVGENAGQGQTAIKSSVEAKKSKKCKE